MDDKKVRLVCIDGLRGIACICIVIYHYSSVFVGGYDGCPLYPVLWPVYKYGWLSVDFFFLVSGFCMAYNYTDKATDKSVVSFLAKRIKKIYPTYIVTLLLAFGLKVIAVSIWGIDEFVSMSATTLSLSNLIFGLCFMETPLFNTLPYNGVLWFINVLVICYVIFWIVNQIKDRNLYLFIIMGLLAVSMGCYYYKILFPYLYPNCVRGYMCFLTGLLLYEIKGAFSNEKLMGKYCMILLIGICILAIGLKEYDFIEAFDSNSMLTMNFGIIIFPLTLMAVLQNSVGGGLQANYLLSLENILCQFLCGMYQYI